ncbi:MAG: RHS repeat-associated core domain-containing protein, partial [Acidimicrobiales bacterium]
DWDGDGDDTIGIYRPTTNTYQLRNTYNGGAADITVVPGPLPPTQPHAVADISGTTNDCNGAGVGTPDYCYDANGNLTGRPGSTGNQSLAWDLEHRLDTVTDAGNTTSFMYDPDGTRLVRKTATDTTIYIDGHEITSTGTTITARRYYTLGSTQMAVRDSAGSGSLNYLLGDQLGSTTVSVNAAGGTPVVQRYLPYGASRSTTGGSAVTDRGWIGQTKDTSTGLQYLNARYYDPSIGRFAAADPVIHKEQVGSLDRFGYGLGRPTTLSDPTGLWVELENRGSTALAQMQRAHSAGLGLKPVTGRYHARWPARVPYVQPPRVPPSPRSPFGSGHFHTAPATSVRIDGQRYLSPPGRVDSQDGDAGSDPGIGGPVRWVTKQPVNFTRWAMAMGQTNGHLGSSNAERQVNRAIYVGVEEADNVLIGGTCTAAAAGSYLGVESLIVGAGTGAASKWMEMGFANGQFKGSAATIAKTQAQVAVVATAVDVACIVTGN